MDAQKNVARVTDVPAVNIKELFYDPTVTPSMLWVLTDRTLYVLRGY